MIEVPDVRCDSLETPSGIEIFFTGPPLSAGSLPGFIYFSVSGKESLCLSPYNQPAAFLQDLPLRVYSLTLPAHGEGFDRFKAIEAWGQAFARGDNVLKAFLDRAEAAVDYLFSEGLLSEGKLAVGGLSRGAFVATQLAAREQRIGTLVGFAPLTDLSFSAHFASIRESSEVTGMALHTLVDRLIDTDVRFYIGNRDVLVSTRLAFNFIEQLSEAAFQGGVRSPRAELIISPAIGHKGHGTAPETFYSGARWVEERLL